MPKVCLKCKELKDDSEFYPCKNSKDNLGLTCRHCISIQGKQYRNSLIGLIKKTYKNQIFASKKRNHPPPDYTEEEFVIWFIRQDNFLELYNAWVESVFNSKLKPSGDRLDDYKPYSFGNLRLVTWGENEAKLHKDVKCGINNKKSKGCIQISLDGEIIAEYFSLREAARCTNSDSAGIAACCKGKQKKHNGYIWKYKENE